MAEVSLKPNRNVVFRRRSGKELIVNVQKVEPMLDGVRFKGQNLKEKAVSKGVSYDDLNKKDLLPFKRDVERTFNVKLSN